MPSLRRRSGSPTHVRITATHTHSGGPVAPGWYPEGTEMIPGYSNGEVGYIPMKPDYKNGGYGVWSSAMAPGAAEQLIEAAGDLLESI